MAVSEADFALQVIESLSSGVVGIDASGRVVLFNEGARRVLGESAGPGARVLGRPVAEVLAAEPRLVSLLLGALDGRSPVSRAELTLAGARTAGFTLHAVRDPAGELRGAVLLLRDLTPFEHADARERQRERLAALGQMAAGMAHEIRNPLAGMEVIAGLLRRRLSGEGHELALELSDQIQSVAATVSASLDFVRPLEPRSEPVDVAGLVDAALRRGTARSAGSVEVERVLEAPLPELRGDPALLTTALANLVSNACESMAAGDVGARLVVRVGAAHVERGAAREREADHEPALRAVALRPELVISVQDSGPGIPEADRERIFYPFYTTKQNGSGIGLAQAQKIAMAHGGCITLEGAGGRGATFHLHLPAEPSAAAPAP